MNSLIRVGNFLLIVGISSLSISRTAMCLSAKTLVVSVLNLKKKRVKC